MHQEILLVDFENIQPVDIATLNRDCAVIIFMGARQDRIRNQLGNSIQTRGTLVTFIKVDGVGKNALDFHIACHLGRILEKSPHVHCTVISKDTGYDPLLRYLNKEGLKCRRISNVSEVDARPTSPSDHKYRRVVGQSFDSQPGGMTMPLAPTARPHLPDRPPVHNGR